MSEIYKLLLIYVYFDKYFERVTSMILSMHLVIYSTKCFKLRSSLEIEYCEYYKNNVSYEGQNRHLIIAKSRSKQLARKFSIFSNLSTLCKEFLDSMKKFLH